MLVLTLRNNFEYEKLFMSKLNLEMGGVGVDEGELLADIYQT